MIKLVLNPTMSVSDVVPSDDKTHTIVKSPPPTRPMAICSNVHLVPSNQRALIRDLRSVTYHLPLDFWTSLLLKLCDLAVHTVKVQEKKTWRSSSVCVYARQREKGSPLHNIKYTFV